jgi:hypothetical protein
VLRAHIDVDGTSERHNADVYVAVALDHIESQVLRGENGGKHLSHVAVVEPLKRVGKLEKGRKFGQDVELKLNPSVRSSDLRIVVFVQEPGAWAGEGHWCGTSKDCELAALELENGFRIEAKFPDHGLKAQTGGPAMMRRGVARYPYSCG